jgi:hypothetical protein
MKIVATSNYSDEAYAESVVAENIKVEPMAKIMCQALNDKYCNEYSYTFYQVKPDDYRLWRGMEDLV